MGLTDHLNNASKLSFFAWNINGLSSKSLGDKLQNVDCLNMINDFDFLIFCETWNETNIEVTGYRSVVTGTSKTTKSGRNSGGLALLYKNEFHDWITVEKASPNFLWFKISRQYTKAAKDIFVCGIYIPPCGSNYFHPELFEDLENDIEIYSSQGSILLMGDLNSRTGKYSDSVCQEGNNMITNDQSEFAICSTQRNSFDNELNNHGKRLLELCRSADLRILNGRVSGDSLGRATFHGRNGTSVVDYSICDQDLFQHVANFIVKEPSCLSDHSPIVTWLNINTNISNRDAIPANDTLTSLPKQFCWEHDSTQKFKDALRSPSTQTLIREFLNDNESTANVNISLKKVENIFIATAKRCLKIKTIKKHKRVQLSTNKKWFDKECRLKRHELRKLANKKHRDPLNVILREEYHTVLKQYKNLLNNKRNEYYNNKISELEETALDSDKKHFWNCLKSIDDSVKLKHTPPGFQKKIG